MAYGNTSAKPKYSGNSNKGAGLPVRTTGADRTDKPAAETVFKTGLFKSEGGKSLASVQVKEDVMIPAGSYINLFENEQKTEKHPPFTISVRTGVLKQK